MKKFALSGLMFSGKDFVADTAKLKKLTVAGPIYELAKSLTGVGRDQPNTPGLRALWQSIGQWGWGSISAQYPLTAERALLTRDIRNHGHEMAPSYAWVEWHKYGTRKDFWIATMLHDLAARPDEDFEGYNGVVMSSTRFRHELEPLKANGFEHYLVACHEDTRRARMAAAGCNYSERELNDESERMSLDLLTELPRHRIIWNDDWTNMPEGALTIQEFVSIVRK